MEKVFATLISTLGDQTQSVASSIHLVLGSSVEDIAYVNDVLRSSFIVSSQNLHGKQMAELGHRDVQSLGDLDALCLLGRLGLYSRGSEQEVHDRPIFAHGSMKARCSQASCSFLLQEHMESVPETEKLFYELFGLLIVSHRDGEIDISREPGL